MKIIYLLLSGLHIVSLHGSGSHSSTALTQLHNTSTCTAPDCTLVTCTDWDCTIGITLAQVHIAYYLPAPIRIALQSPHQSRLLNSPYANPDCTKSFTLIRFAQQIPALIEPIQIAHCLPALIWIALYSPAPIEIAHCLPTQIQIAQQLLQVFECVCSLPELVKDVAGVYPDLWGDFIKY